MDLYVENKPEGDEAVPGKPYPQEFGTSKDKVRGFINNYWDKRDEKPRLFFQIICALAGAVLLGVLFHFFYNNTTITLMFAALGGWLGYTAFMSFFRKSIREDLLKMMSNTPEGVYLSALELWTRKEFKENLKTRNAKSK